MVNVGGASVLSVVSVSRCDATATAGCRAEAPGVSAHESLISADPATGTIYAGNSSLRQIDVLDGATCHAGDLTGCASVAEIPVGHPMANGGLPAVTSTGRVRFVRSASTPLFAFWRQVFPALAGWPGRGDNRGWESSRRVP